MQTKLSFALVLAVIMVGLASLSPAAGRVSKPVARAAAVKVIKVTAERYKFTPNPIVLKKGELTELRLTSLDVHHGFNCPGLNLRADALTHKTTYLRVKAAKKGTYPFFCDVYCGEGHETMNGSIEVID